MARVSLTLVGIIFIFLLHNEPVLKFEIGEVDVQVEYPCLSSSNDCLSEIDISGGTFQMYSSFRLIQSPMFVALSSPCMVITETLAIIMKK